MSVLFGNYRRQEVAFARGQGCRLWDTTGKAYLDFIAGIAVSALGHNHPELVRAIAEQAARVIHVSNLFTVPEQEAAGEALVKASGLDRVFFCNSGAEANEAALKMARKASSRGAFQVLSAQHGFHGRTMGALAATGTPAYHEGFQPLPAGFTSLPYNDLAAFEGAFSDQVCAVILEPLQGEGGIIPGDPAFLRGVQELCQKHGALFIMDEVQTGIGRTGSMFGFQELGLEPDVVTLAKGLGGGVPIGAVLAREAVAAVMVPGTHGCTFGGNPLSCQAARVVLGEVPKLLASVRALGERLQAGLRDLGFSEVRGKGLLVGADCADAKALEAACRERGLLVNAVRPTTLRFAPPLVLTDQELEEALGILGQALESLKQTVS